MKGSLQDCSPHHKLLFEAFKSRSRVNVCFDLALSFFQFSLLGILLLPSLKGGKSFLRILWDARWSAACTLTSASRPKLARIPRNDTAESKSRSSNCYLNLSSVSSRVFLCTAVNSSTLPSHWCLSAGCSHQPNPAPRLQKHPSPTPCGWTAVFTVSMQEAQRCNNKR